jgi:uncharacterized LabA/DUF88 family protein
LEADLDPEFDPRIPAKFVGTSQRVQVGGRDFVVDRVFYYDAIDETADEAEALRMDEYLRRVENLPEVKVGNPGFLRRAARRGREQKGVDVQLAVDALEWAYGRHNAAIALVSGDADFAPLMEAIRHTGTYAFVVAWEQHLAPPLRSAADRVILLEDLPPTGWGLSADA